MTNRIVVPAALLLSSVVGGCEILGASGESPPAPAPRTYYVAADEVVWDYAPSGMDRITGREFDDYAKLSVESGPERIGRIYKKASYREYTDDTFAQLVPRAPEWEHLGMLGPLLRAAVGDTIVVVFRNNASFPASLHPHGVFYTKESEGAPSDDGTEGADKADDGVPTGGTYTFVWPVPERAGPAEDENSSHYLEENVQTYATEKKTVSEEERAFFHPFGFSNFMESMNGFLFGDLQGLTVREGERVRWYLMATTNFEVHAPHWHGNTVVLNRMRTDVTSLQTMGMQVADMVPDNPGKWLFHCHVKDHLKAGMQAHYTVLPRG